MMMRVDERVGVLDAWRRPYDSRIWDPGVAVGLTVLAFVPALGAVSAQIGELPRRPADAFAVVLLLAQTLPLAVRTSRPAVCLAIVGTSFVLFQALAYPPQFGTSTIYLALYSVGAHQRRFRGAIGTAATAGFIGLAVDLVLRGSPNRPTDFLIFYLFLTGCWALGLFVRRRRAEEAERRKLAADAAAAAERTRIARELHDVVTHHVTVMVVQADATQFLADDRNRVVAGFTTIGESGRRALAELRHMLAVLEAPGDAAARTSAEGTIKDLVDQARLAGQPIDLVEEGETPALSEALRLAVYRVVQEGITNAVKYANGQPTEVRTVYLDGHLAVEVINAAAAAPLPERTRRALSGGRGLSGLKDRVATLGGEVTAMPQPDGGFRLRAVIPI
jgi:signal transduction histidine kinase